MHAEWFLVQLTSDLRRHEPKNVGVVLHAGDSWYLRFRGVDRDGSVNGRLVRSLGVTKETYTSWVGYFHRKAYSGDWEQALTVSIRRPSNFGVVRGGTLLEAGGEWRFALDRLFSDLVSMPEKAAKTPIDLARHLLQRAEVKAVENICMPGRWDDDGEQVDIPFGFGVGRSRPVPLDALSPTPMAVASLKARMDAVARVGQAPKFIAFVPLGRIAGDEKDELLRPVERRAWIVDLDADDAREDLLAKLSG